MLRLRPLALLAALAGCAPDTGITRLYPDVAVAPETLDFGNVVVGDDAALTLQVANAGDGPLAVSSITLEGGGFDGVYTVTPPSLDLGVGESAGVIVTFEPSDYVEYGTALSLQTNDPARPVVGVPVLGQGVDGGPDIELSPASLDFGGVLVGGTATAVFTVSNTGDAPLEIAADSQQTGSGAFSLLSDPRGETIAVGGSYTVLVQYAPTTAGGDAGTLTLASNDPDDPTVSVDFIGNGGATDAYPVAVIDAYATAHPGETLIMDGTGSYDPEGFLPLSYAWALLEAPAASSAALSNPALSAPFITLDASGEYVVALQVTNTQGVSSATTVHTISARPEDSLFVELTWDEADADLDLHLVRDAPDLYFDGEADCCWCNENPDWGTPGDPDDDPVLAEDADGDGGPERVLISDPAEGEYFVRAHYFQDNGAGIVQARVKVYVAGELAGEWSRELTHNEVWEVGYVRWPQGYVIDEDGEPYASEDRTCR